MWNWNLTILLAYMYQIILKFCGTLRFVCYLIVKAKNCSFRFRIGNNVIKQFYRYYHCLEINLSSALIVFINPVLNIRNSFAVISMLGIDVQFLILKKINLKYNKFIIKCRHIVNAPIYITRHIININKINFIEVVRTPITQC